MAEDSKIQWTDATFNPWRGCTKVSAGCQNCYAETLSGRNPKTLGRWGPNGTRVVAAEKGDSGWSAPVKWNRLAAECKLPDGSPNPNGHRPRVFCASFADVFEKWDGPMRDSAERQLFISPTGRWSNDGSGSPVTEPGWRPLTMDDVRARLFKLIAETPHLDWLLLTKRPENVLRMTHDAWCPKVPGHVSQNDGDGRRWAFPPNVWVGATVEDQAAADRRIPHLLKIPAAVRFLSCEPLLERVDLTRYLPNTFTGFPRGPRVDWVIIGGESGGLETARPFHLEWARSLVRQCRTAGVPAFVKQMGSVPVLDYYPEDENPDELEWAQDRERAVIRHDHGNSFVHNYRDGQPPMFSLRVLHMKAKGGDPTDWPEDLRVREFPI